jgi:hypothetical protein
VTLPHGYVTNQVCPRPVYPSAQKRAANTSPLLIPGARVISNTPATVPVKQMIPVLRIERRQPIPDISPAVELAQLLDSQARVLLFPQKEAWLTPSLRYMPATFVPPS